MSENINVRTGSGTARAGDAGSSSESSGPDDSAQLNRIRDKLKSAGVQREFSDGELRAIKRRGQERLERQDSAKETQAEVEVSRGKDVSRSTKDESRAAKLADTTGAERVRNGKKLDAKTERSIRSDPNATPVPGNPPDADPADAQQARKLLSSLLGNILIGDEPLDIETYAQTLRKMPPSQPKDKKGGQDAKDAGSKSPGTPTPSAGKLGGPVTLPKPGVAAQSRAAALTGEGEGDAETVSQNGQRPGQSPGQTGRRTGANTRRTPNAMSLLEATRNSANPANAGIGARGATPTRGATLGGTPSQGNGQVGNSPEVSFNAGGSFTSGSVDMGRLARTNLEGFYSVFIIRNAKMAHIWMKMLRELRKWEGKFELAGHKLQIQLLEMRQQFERMNRANDAARSIQNLGEAKDQSKADNVMGQNPGVGRQNSQDMLDNLRGVRSLAEPQPGDPDPLPEGVEKGRQALRDVGVRPGQRILTDSQRTALKNLADGTEEPSTNMPPEMRADIGRFLSENESAQQAFERNGGPSAREGLLRWQLNDVRTAQADRATLGARVLIDRNAVATHEGYSSVFSGADAATLESPQLTAAQQRDMNRIANATARQIANEMGFEGPPEGSTAPFYFTAEQVQAIGARAASDGDLAILRNKYAVAEKYNRTSAAYEYTAASPEFENELKQMIRDTVSQQDEYLGENGTDDVYAKLDETYQRQSGEVGETQRLYEAQSARFMRAYTNQENRPLPGDYRKLMHDAGVQGNPQLRQELQLLIDADDARQQALATRTAQTDTIVRNQPVKPETVASNESTISNLIANAEVARQRVMAANEQLYPATPATADTPARRLGEYRPASEIDNYAEKAQVFDQAVRDVRTHMLGLSYQLANSGQWVDGGVAAPDLTSANARLNFGNGTLDAPSLGENPEYGQVIPEGLPPERLAGLQLPESFYTENGEIDPFKYLEARSKVAGFMMNSSVDSAKQFAATTEASAEYTALAAKGQELAARGESLSDAEKDRFNELTEQMTQADQHARNIAGMIDFKDTYLHTPENQLGRWPGNYSLEGATTEASSNINPILHFRNNSKAGSRAVGSHQEGRPGGTAREINKYLEALSGGLGTAFEDPQFVASVDRAVMGARMGARRSRARSDAMLREAVGKSQGMLNQLVQIQAMSRQV